MSLFTDTFGSTSIDNLIAWNPSLSASDCELQAVYSYCVRQAGNTTATVSTTIIETDVPSTTSGTSTSTTSSAAVPSPTQAGVANDCTAWHLVIDGDGCWAISQEYGISLDGFYALNPGVGDDCSSLWLDYYVCVGV
ncbi:hypothetical protein E8E14_013247 [Neopestalotiopsis sp. 37M]|nr:hypothetical protein E8E14_013247 [Neopestalotiopsis sp. 37M]